MALKIEKTERWFLYGTVVVLVAFLVAIVLSIAEAGIHLPGKADSIEFDAEGRPMVTQTPPFDSPGVTQTGDNSYRAVVIAQAWLFNPAEIRVPRGAEVEFVVTSADVIHGFMIPKTTVNAMVIPGEVTEITATFDEAGEHLIICHEFCGLGHHTMFGRVIVE